MTSDSKKIRRIISVIIFINLIAACNPGIMALSNTDAVASATPADPIEIRAPEEGQPAKPEVQPLFNLPDNLAKITPENLQDISELASIFPYFPPYYHISNDGSRVAIGDMQTVEIRDAASGEILSSIPASLPDCDFGFDRYFRLNADGSFIALVNGQSIQVWQVGGGLIYENPLFSGNISNAPTCGADIPELALSPDGKLLAISAMAYSRTSVERYFRVIDILANTLLYEWDGKSDTLHGSLYTFHGLGFSDDGKLLQSFDPARFIRSEGNVHQAFRFWSVDDWQEVERTSQLVGESFQAGELLFPLSDSGLVEIRSKVSGEISAEIVVDGCQWDVPCETRFSNEGRQAVVISQAGEKIRFKTNTLHPFLSIWDLTKNQEISSEPGLFRDLEGVLPWDDGKVLRADQVGKEEKEPSGWWTFKDYFAGLQILSDGKVTFSPLTANSNDSQVCQFCATCSVDTEKGEITCSRGLIDSEGARIYLKEESGQFILARQSGADEKMIGEIALSESADQSKTRVRLLGYSMPLQTLFYCVDDNSRQAGCFVYDPYIKKVISAPGDISYLRLSTDGLKAAFINRTVNALLFYDLSSKSLMRKHPYQARSFPVNPVFSADGTKFFYVIQNLNNANDLSVETLDAQTGKSFGRVSLKKAGITSPTVFSVSNDGTFWAIAERSGEVSILSPEKGVLLHQWQAHPDEIIGMALAPDQKWILTMGENGILKFWGVE